MSEPSNVATILVNVELEMGRGLDIKGSFPRLDVNPKRMA